jgi:hypothetical protein
MKGKAWGTKNPPGIHRAGGDKWRAIAVFSDPSRHVPADDDEVVEGSGHDGRLHGTAGG